MFWREEGGRVGGWSNQNSNWIWWSVGNRLRGKHAEHWWTGGHLLTDNNSQLSSQWHTRMHFVNLSATGSPFHPRFMFILHNRYFSAKKYFPKKIAPTRHMDAIIWKNTVKLLYDKPTRSSSGTKQSQTEKHLEVQQGNPIRLAWLRFVTLSFSHLVFPAVFTSSMSCSNCPQMFFFFKCNLPGVKDCKVLITTSVGSWYFGETCTTQHYIYTLIRRLYRIHTQISVFEKYHSTKADLYAKQSNRHGVMITSQTFWACTHGLSDRGEQSTMGSDSCIYQHI